MPTKIQIDPANLGAINLYGLQPEKLAKARARDEQARKERIIHIRNNPAGDTDNLILDGHHTAVVAYELGETVFALLWEKDEVSDDVHVRMNFSRAPSLHDTAMLIGLGTVPQLAEQAAAMPSIDAEHPDPSK